MEFDSMQLKLDPVSVLKWNQFPIFASFLSAIILISCFSIFVTDAKNSVSAQLYISRSPLLFICHSLSSGFYFLQCRAVCILNFLTCCGFLSFAGFLSITFTLFYHSLSRNITSGEAQAVVRQQQSENTFNLICFCPGELQLNFNPQPALACDHPMVDHPV